jgi:hypothetical protein
MQFVRTTSQRIWLLLTQDEPKMAEKPYKTRIFTMRRYGMFFCDEQTVNAAAGRGLEQKYGRICYNITGKKLSFWLQQLTKPVVRPSGRQT